ncbi:hypothetical protein VN97_g6486 [Penicillium thymicola]|uniref:Uncharacterized protein n=1 Tax=Penicillium thymicola TaxID=293382 RepID=A0AAI9TI44_PENTH|nr:hypothetical protein VN97_g6486 [Penicillium thymicola]
MAVKKTNGTSRDRTSDLANFSRTLSQLSYRPTWDEDRRQDTITSNETDNHARPRRTHDPPLLSLSLSSSSPSLLFWLECTLSSLIDLPVIHGRF